MQKLKALKKLINPDTNLEIKKGEVFETQNNTAHYLIDNELAKLFIPSDNKNSYNDKQMKPRRTKRGYITK